MKYRDCIFDLYGTLVDIHTDESRPALWQELAVWYRAHGATYRAQTLHDAYCRVVGQMEKAFPPQAGFYPEIQLELVFQRLFQEKGLAADLELVIRTGQRFRKASLDYIRLYDGAVALLTALRAGGQRAWLLSNAQRIFTADELRVLGIEGLFDGVYLSSDYGCKKPDRRFYERLLRERGITPERAIMIGNDSLCDIQGAQAVDLATMYIRSNLSPAEPLPKADYILEQMDLYRVRTILTGREA